MGVPTMPKSYTSRGRLWWPGPSAVALCLLICLAFVVIRERQDEPLFQPQLAVATQDSQAAQLRSVVCPHPASCPPCPQLPAAPSCPACPKLPAEPALHIASEQLPASAARAERWGEQQIIQYLVSHPDRAFFSRLFRDGGFRTGMEVGVADGRFSEHFLRDNAGLPWWVWYMVEPFPNEELKKRFPSDKHGTADFYTDQGVWAKEGVGSNTHKVFIKKMSNDPQVLKDLADKSFDFIYLDGAHEYKNVKLELKNIWPKLRPGGVFAGHDYCDYREKPHPPCQGCDTVPLCTVYTPFNDKLSGTKVKSQWGVVQAVHEWLSESHPELKVYNTQENFTPESLATEGMDYNLVLTKTRNPSWFIYKPL